MTSAVNVSREHMEVLRTLLDSFPHPAFLADLSLTIIAANGKFIEEYGNSVGEKCYKAVHDRNSPISDCPIKEAISKGLIAVEKEVYMKNEGRWYEYCAYPLKIDNSTLFMVLMRDITNRKLSEEMEEERLKFLKGANEILQFVGKMIRHDVINQLNSIISALEIKEELGEERFRDIVEKAARRGVEILKKTKDIEKFFKMKKVRVKNVVEEVAGEFNAEFEIVGDCEVFASEALSSVFENLFSNSVKHGKATKIRVEIKSRGEWCEIIVSDNGKGIPREIRDRIFEEGFSYGSSGGMGIGLFITKHVVEMCGGEIELLDSSNGARFLIRLKKANC